MINKKQIKKTKSDNNIDHNSLAELLWEYKIEEKALVDIEVNLKKQINHFESLDPAEHEAVLQSLKNELSKIITSIDYLKDKISKLKANINLNKVNQDMRKMIATLEKQIANYKLINKK